MKNSKFLVRIFLTVFVITGITSGQIQFDNEKVSAVIFSSQDKVYPNSQLKIAVEASIESGWHINSNKPNEDFLIPTEINLQNDSLFKLTNIEYPEAENLKFEFSDEPLSVYEGTILIYGNVDIPDSLPTGNYNLKIDINYQSCNNQTCLPPAVTTVPLEIEVVGLETPISSINEEKFISGGNQDSGDNFFSQLESAGLFWALVTVFLGGLALNLTPCVYPLIPITIGYFGGQSEGRTGRLFVLGLLYVLGMALTYSIVGVITALSGAVFGSLLQNPVVIIVIAAIFITLSLSMFGVYEFKLPDSWVAKAGGAKSGIFGAFFMGLTMGIVAAPCIGPFVLGLVTYVGAKGDPYYGFMLFFFLAVGLGFPYLVLALFSGKIKSLPKAGMWMEAVKHIFGFLLLGMAIYFVSPLLPKSIAGYILPVFMLIAAIIMLFFDKTGNEIKIFRTIRVIISLLLLAASVYFLIPSGEQKLEWDEYNAEAFENAVGTDKVILDFYADWCIPCKELDAITFSDSRVQNQLKDFKRIKVDMTVAMNDETRRIREKFQIVGVPTIILFNADGTEKNRITGFMPPEEFLKLISETD